MQRNKKKILSPATPDDDGISNSQTPAAGGVQSLTITGALAADGIATLDVPRRVLITSAGNDSGHSFVVTGTADGQRVISETVTGPNTTTTYTTKDFKTVTSVTISANAAGAIKVGTNQVMSTPWIPVDRYGAASLGVDVKVSGTANYTIEHTMDDPFSMAPTNDTGDVALTPFAHPVLQQLAANANGYYDFPITAVRLTLNSYTGSPTVTAAFAPGAM